MMCSVVLFMSILLLNLTINSVNSLPTAANSYHVFRNNTTNDSSEDDTFPDDIEELPLDPDHHYCDNYYPNISDYVYDRYFNYDINYPNISDYAVPNDGATSIFQSLIEGDSAACLSKLRTIELVNGDDPSIKYIPHCIRVERCGGCCSDKLLFCQPTENGIERITYQVIKTKPIGMKKWKYMGKRRIVVEKHTKCKCSCKVKAEDCNIFQEYRKNECRCICRNRDEEKKCEIDKKIKLWNPENCWCECRNTLSCSTGYYFDFNKCRCVGKPLAGHTTSYSSYWG